MDMPPSGVEIKVVDDARNTLPAGVEGEEASRGPNVFMGYLDEPELTARALDQDGWYYSGDLCRMDDAGYIKNHRTQERYYCARRGKYQQPRGRGYFIAASTHS